MSFERRRVKQLIESAGGHHLASKRMNIENNKTNRRGSGASPIVISLTDFVDFVSKSGSPKLTHVEQVKWRLPYDPMTDFWRRLRETIVDWHRRNKTAKADLDIAIQGLTHQPKIKAYPAALAGYKKFLGAKQFQPLPEVRSTWTYGGLNISVNPELSVEINGAPHVIKLYFKSDPLSKKQADLILLMMADALAGKVVAGTTYGLLDVQRGKLYTVKLADTRLKPLLQGEAASFETIWNQIATQRPRKIRKSDAA
jgi:hypothetical protein